MQVATSMGAAAAVPAPHTVAVSPHSAAAAGGGGSPAPRRRRPSTRGSSRYALWLVPHAEAFEAAMAACRPFRELVQMLRADGSWGGHVHMTLCSFGYPFQLNADLQQVASKVAAALPAGSHAMWTGEGLQTNFGRRSKSMLYCVPAGASTRTLQHLTDTLAAMHATNPRAPQDLHVTWRGRSHHYSAEQFVQANHLAIQAVLKGLTWDVAVVCDRSPGDPHHRDVTIAARFPFYRKR